MKVVYDNIIFAKQKGGGGISVVWGELLKRALRDGFDLSFVEFSPMENIVRDELPIPADRTRTVPVSLRKAFKYLPVRVHSREPFIFHSSFFRICLNPKAINITTVHDFTNELFQTGAGPRKERWIKRNAIRHSDYIICISENTRRDFFRFFPDFPEDRVRVIYNGVSEDFCPLDDCGPLPFPRGSYLLFVGARDGYKHFDILPAVLSRSGLKLVLTGAPLSEAEESQLKGCAYQYAGHVSTKELNCLYNGAFSLVYPSLYEGFGLPVIEAQRAGCPVIAGDASSIPEIIGDRTLLMESSTPECVLEKLAILNNPEERARIIRAGQENARRFSWEKMYQEVRDLYEQAISGGKRR